MFRETKLGKRGYDVLTALARSSKRLAGVAVFGRKILTYSAATCAVGVVGGPVGSIAIDPAGRFLYFGNPFEGNVVGYAIASSTGLLTQVPGFIQTVDSGIVNSVDPTGHFLYALYPANESVSFPIDQSSGELGTLTLGPASAMIEAYSSTP